MAFYHRRTCRLCKSASLGKVLSITPTPPANAFVSENELDREQACYPLELWFCRNCAHVQLLDVVDAEELFSNYVYVSGTSSVFTRHFQNYADNVISYTSPRPGSLIVDLGSNDGTLLGFFKDRAYRVLGVDPARKIAEKASAAGIETIAAFFDSRVAEDIVDQHGKAAIVTANNVFAHIDDLDEVVQGIDLLLGESGFFIFEVSYLLDLYENRYFDMIYHEHLDYHSVKPLENYFRLHAMQLVRVERVPSHGGSIRCYVQKRQAGRSAHESVRLLMELEAKRGLDREETFLTFDEEIREVGETLGREIARIRGEGRTLAAFGAPAKATTLMYHFGISADDVTCIIDDSPVKQGLYSPGLHIPVVSSAVLEESPPDYLLILAWNFAESIMENHRSYLEQGGKFIVPLPELRIIAKHG